jgi:hypothetical protein
MKDHSIVHPLEIRVDLGDWYAPTYIICPSKDYDIAWAELENISINSAEHAFSQVAVQALVDDLQSYAHASFCDRVSNHFFKKPCVPFSRELD